MNTGSCSAALSPLIEHSDELGGQDDRMANLFEDDEVLVILAPAAALARGNSKSLKFDSRGHKQVQVNTLLVEAEGSGAAADRG